MKREIVKTADGSTTIHLPEWNEQYHSIHGAIQEARHVFILMGLYKFLERQPEKITILEIGFGTGLNALVTWEEIRNKKVEIHYTGVEAYPVLTEEVDKMNFPAEMDMGEASEIFKDLHSVSWETPQTITENFILTKQQKYFHQIEDQEKFDLVYFDAFGARVQPELWTEDVFQKMINALKPSGILVTYAAKGSVRRAMQEVGFLVEKLPGPPGKREMLRATKSGV